MNFESALPREELFRRDLIDTASLLDRDPAATHGGDHRGLTTDDPPLDARIWQLLDKPGPAHRLTRGRFHQAPPSSTGSHLAPAGPARDGTGRKDSCMLAASLCHWPRVLAAAQLAFVSRSFHVCKRVATIFSNLRIGASVRKYGLLKAGQMQRSGSDPSCKAYAVTGSVRRQISVSRFFHVTRSPFFTLGSCVGANFTLV